ncbi:MAG: hypothetical protein Q9174_003698, partial [Haloplaca sp. 1 TL-2023]
MAGKLDVWESTLRRLKPGLGTDDQNEIDRLLLMSPRTPQDPEASPGRGSHQEHGYDHTSDSDSDGGESAASVGSMGSTDHLNEGNYAAHTARGGRTKAFLGQTATDNWVERLKDNLRISETDELSGLHPLSYGTEPQSKSHSLDFSDATGGGNAPNLGPSMFAEHFEPFEMPSKMNADVFVNAYFSTIHPCFPILSQNQVLKDYESFAGADSRILSEPVLAMLHLVFALGAIHTYMAEMPQAREEKSHLLSFAVAKAAVLDANVLRSTTYEQAQGMHLINTTPNMPDAEKELRGTIWFSVLSLERTVTVITGRPSIIRDLDCSAVLQPTPTVSIKNRKSVRGPNERPNKQALQGIQSSNFAPDATFFKQYVDLTSLADEALSTLYSAHTRDMKWSEAQATILKLDQKLSTWNSKLPKAFLTDLRPQEMGASGVSLSLGMLFYSTRIIINRPCLCRLDRRISKHSKVSDAINMAAAERCVVSARGMLNLLPNGPGQDPSIIYRAPLWWMAFHHLKRAATVLILEMTFQAEHTPAASEEMLDDAKKAINWLHVIGASSTPAHSAWITLSQLLLRAAQKFGGDVSDTVIAQDKKDVSPKE